jgi:hypothetical protein
MMKTRFVMFIQRSLRHSQSGQSIVILALGFVALLGFVGIVTDVSLMFVRYSTLTRAVDAASIAAAGQVRRQVPFQSEINEHCTGVGPNGLAWSPSNPCDAAEAAAFARSFGNIGVAARQFIEFYGLDPSAVLIDMCFTVADPTDPSVPLNDGVADEYEELCEGPTGRNRERKLIKVTAQIESPTVFLHLLGFQTILLEASSISETAVLDVVLIMDVSESMAYGTTYDTWAAQGYNQIYVPPDIYYFNYNTNNNQGSGIGFGVARNHNFADLTGFRNYNPGGSPDPYPGNKWYHFRSDLAKRSPADVYSLLCSGAECEPSSPGGFRNPFEIKVFQVPGTSGPSKPLRIQCQVAYFPYASLYYPNVVGGYLDTLYKQVGLNGGMGWTVPNRTRDAFIPSYDYYRCCNDPDGDGSFADLLCEPFRETRQATEQFLQRIDFLRGDRVAFVNFDRRAFLVRRNVPGTDVYTHMLDNEALAIDTLNTYIGVRAEPSFYQPTTLGDGTQVLPWMNDAAHPYGKSDLLGRHDYEAVNACPFHDAALDFPFSPVSSPAMGNAWGLPYDPLSYPNRLMPVAFNGVTGGQRMYPRGTAWESLSGYSARYSYDLRASCRGGNIGAALREGSNALVDPFTTRTNGSVWVMVLLSDGASGASDPVFDTSLAGGPGTEPNDLYYPYNSNTTRVTYGGFGLCPAGTPGNRTELTDFNETPYEAPFCSDEIPETRHFCFDPNKRRMINGQMVNLYVDLGENCDPYYDVDDYARDWADWIGLSEPPGLSNTSQRSLTQLPTIFTIGFGLNFQLGNTNECKAGSIQSTPFGSDANECLGEELLRYIADVGDNFRIDTDYQQALLTNRAGVLGGMTNEDFGPRGECEEPLPPGQTPLTAGSFNNLVRPKQTRVSCGNYYNAPSTAELGRVFDDIASRMFTRLTQ